MAIWSADLNLHLDQPLAGGPPKRVVSVSEEWPIASEAEWTAIRAEAVKGLAALDAWFAAHPDPRANPWWSAKPAATREAIRVTLLRWT